MALKNKSRKGEGRQAFSQRLEDEGVNVAEIEEDIDNLFAELNDFSPIGDDEIMTGLPVILDPITKRAIRNVNQLVITKSITSTDAATASNYGLVFVSDDAYEVKTVTVSYGTASSGSAALNIERLQGNESLDSGDEILEDNIDLTQTANTAHSSDISSAIGVALVSNGDRLALKDSGTLTALEDLVVTIELQRI